MPPPARRQTRSIPLNAALNGQELSEMCSIFVLSKSEHASSPRGLMGLIAISFLGTRGFLCSHTGAALPLAFGDHMGT